MFHDQFSQSLSETGNHLEPIIGDPLSHNPMSHQQERIGIYNDHWHWDEDTPRKELSMRNWPPLPNTLPPPLPNALAMDNWPPVPGVRPPPLPGTANMDNWPPLPSTLPPPLP